jgi:5'-3' exonuclease
LQLVFDGSNLIHRVYHANKVIPVKVTSESGDDLTLVNGVLRSVAGFCNSFPSAKLFFVWGGSKQRRSSIHPEYKATQTGLPEEVKNTLPYLRECLTLLGVDQVENPNEEGDDVLASLVTQRGGHWVIVSTDEDFLQLVTPKVTLLSPKVGKREKVAYDPEAVGLRFGFPPAGIPVWKSLVGDSSDNIKGFRFRKEVATAIAKTARSVSEILNTTEGTDKDWEKLKQNEPTISRNLTLVTLVRDCTYDLTPGALEVESFESRAKALGMQSDAIVAPFQRAKTGGFFRTGNS